MDRFPCGDGGEVMVGRNGLADLDRSELDARFGGAQVNCDVFCGMNAEELK